MPASQTNPQPHKEVTMNRLIKAIKQYFSISFKWWTPLLALGAAGGIICAAMLADLDLMITEAARPLIYVVICAYLHMAVPGFFLMGALRSSEHKFFSVSTYAKSFFTTAPIISALMLSLPIDIILYLALDSALSAEKLIINAVHTVFVCFFVSSANKSGQQIAALIALILYIFQFRLWSSPSLMNGFSLSVPAGIAIALTIYIGGTALNLLAADMWWNKSGRTMSGKDGLSSDINAAKKILYILDR